MIGTTPSLLTTMGSSTSFIIKRQKDARAIIVYLTISASLISTACAIQYLSLQINALSVRKSAHIAREISIENQLRSNPKIIRINAVPVISISQAVDVENSDHKQTDWLIKSIYLWYGINRSITYTTIDTDNEYCTKTSRFIKYAFHCANRQPMPR